jgi:hypothetical protein
MKEPVDHVLRPQLPWRSCDSAITECGYDASKVKAITRAELQARLKDMGEQRTAILTCMTCVETATRWVSWDQDPRQALDREIQWEYRGRWSGNDRGKRLYFELQAVAALVEAHRAEFDERMTRLEGLEAWQTTKADRQQERTRRRTRGRVV